MKVGDLVNHNPSCFDEGRAWMNGIIVESNEDLMEGSLTQHRVYWSPQTVCWTEEGLLEVSSEGFI